MKAPRRGPARPSFMPTGRTITIRNLVERIERETGRSPTDAEIAGMLAIGPGTVRRHRERIARRGSA